MALASTIQMSQLNSITLNHFTMDDIPSFSLHAFSQILILIN